MSQSKLRKAIGAVKDQTSIGLAKVGSSNSLSDLDVAIVKATRHDEYPAEERHVREILSLTCYSRAFISACVNTLSRRLSKTSSWTVALKTLVLIQRLLTDGDHAYEQEIFFSTRRGTRLLNMSDFRDQSKSNSWDFSAFVRTYALYLDERLEYRMQNRRGKRSRFGSDEDEEEPRERERDRHRERDKDREVNVKATPVREIKTEQLFSKMQHLQLLLERFLACRPTGRARTHRIVTVALYPIVKESFQIYHDMTEILGILIDRFTDMVVPECIKVYDIFCRVGKQYDELDLFYSWSKSIGIARSSEYPDIERVTTKKLEIMDQYIKEKSHLAQTKKLNTQEEKNEEEEAEPEEDMNAIKALPPPEEFHEEQPAEVKEEIMEKEPKEEKVVQTEGDLLNLEDDFVTNQEHGDTLALALFDGAAPATSATQALPWHAFDDGADWETALVQSTSNLSNQKPSLGGGFDTLLLNSMYKQAETNAAMQGLSYGVSGSASSLALGSAGRPAMLALPAPPTSRSGSSSASTDPFAASLAVAPPAYIQMSEMEKKQRLLMEEQVMWQQYARAGTQGQVAFTQTQPNNTYMGGYPQNYGYYYH
ncbi:putative clathrin assembly protein At1g03050 [Gastrolobium bilobum]|uniref:putative clathrin assembly protein At1g03050 n=1 Tax=Gastrolobium bilobum TaxID=150636 RepID=UPI002AAF8385|nr:putative clathrin assembly protein At1g03050 [Gastrolobium bilobum]